MKTRSVFISFICLVFLSVCLSGCETLKGTASGLVNTACNFGKGLKADWKSVKEWDKNFKENWW